MESVKVYEYLNQKDSVLGLEMIDMLGLLLLYALVFLFSSSLFINIGIMTFAYICLRLYKRGKPRKYTESLIRFIWKPFRYTVSEEKLNYEMGGV